MSGMASFLAGFGGGYLKADRQKTLDERQAKMDAMAEEEFNRKKAEWQDQDQLKADLKDAGAVRTMLQGTVTDAQTGAGPMQRTFTQNPEEASRVKAMMDAEAEMTGAAPAVAQRGTAITGKMAQGHQIGMGQVAKPEELNSADAVAQRTAQAYRQNGQMEKALAMENAVMDSKLKKLGLTKAEADHADELFDRTLKEKVPMGKGFGPHFAKVLTDTKVAGLDGFTFESVSAADGKSVEIVGTGPKGEKISRGTFTDDDKGWSEAMRRANSAKLETKIAYVVEKAKADKEDSRWERTFDFNKKKEENDQQYKNRVLGFQAAQDKRAAETHKVAMESEKVPAAVKQMAGSYQKQIESVSAALNKAMAEGSFNPENKGTKDLIAEQAALREEYKKLLAPHMPSGAKSNAPAADPYGFEKPAPGAAAPQTAAAPKPAATPTAPVASMQQVAPAMAPKAPTVLEALNPGGNASLAAVVQPKAQAIESLAVQLKQEQAAMAQVAGANPQAAIAQAQKVQGIRNAINKQLEGMNPEQAALVIKAAGI